jgi:IMP dehydrogenase/GMP reductase
MQHHATPCNTMQHNAIAGNVVTGEMVEELILSGADIVKVTHLNTIITL